MVVCSNYLYGDSKQITVKVVNSFILVLGICLVLASTAAYQTGQETRPTTECNDGIDNDLDNQIDGNDPGCNQPLYEDDNENDLYDLAATTVFSDLESGDSDSEIISKLKQGPSAYYGWKATTVGTEDFPNEVFTRNGNTYLNVTYVNNSRKRFGGEAVNWTEIQLNGMTATTDRNSPFAGLVDSPAPDTSTDCGDGFQASDEDTINCAEDAGLPSQDGEAAGTISNDLGEYSVSGGTDDVKYVFDLEIPEYHTEDLSNDRFTESVEGICDTSGSCDDQPARTFYKKYEKNQPDFFLRDDSTEIWAVYPEPDGETEIGQVDDYGLEERNLYSSFTEETSGSCSGANCTSFSFEQCTSYSTYSEHTLSDDYKDLSINSQNISTDPDSGSYQKVEEQQSVNLRIDHDNRGGTTSTDYYECDSSSSVTFASCSSSIDCDSSGTSKGGETYYTFSGNDDYPIDYYGPDTKTYYVKNYDLQTEKVFDLEPASNPDSVLVKGALFNDDFNVANIVQRSLGGEGWFSVSVPSDGRDQGNDYAVSLSRFSITTDSEDNFISQREESHTYDADGRRGFGDGFIAISEGSVVGSSLQFLQNETTDEVSGDFVGVSDLTGQKTLNCPGDTIKCVASVDVNLTNFDQWSSTDPNSGLSFHLTDRGPYAVDESMGTCKMYQSLYQNSQGSTDSDLKCETDGGGTGYSGSDDDGDGPGPDVCGVKASEHHIYMEGPEVNEDTLSSYPRDYEACIDTSRGSVTTSSCNLRGEIVEEGHVADIAPPSYSDAEYEEGGNSPDAEVCLDLEDTGIGNEGDEVAGDNQGDDLDNQDYGGEWYDLDSEMAQEYIRGVEDGTYSTQSGDDLISDGDSNDANDIAYYWNEDVNPPQNDQYNPQGGRSGTAMEDDCGNPRFDSLKCDDQGDTNDRGHGATDSFFSFFQEGLRDDDFDPQGQSGGEGNSLTGFTGTINRMQEMSDQLEPGMATDTYAEADYTRWEDTRGNEYADEWAISLYQNWSIDSTGTPYPPYSAWYREESNIRTSPDSPSVSKMAKAFGNSYSAVAVESFTGQSGNQIESGDGVWIDPDMMLSDDRFRLTPEGEGWRAALSREDPRTGVNSGFKLDLTGDDAGLGVDVTSNPECLSLREGGGCKVVAEEIAWEQDDSGNLRSGLEQPICGDDRHEFLIEEVGESDNSNQFSGPYACADSINSCFDGDSVREEGAYVDTDEPGEDEGRLKDDKEICQRIESQDDYAIWYDQDYRDDFCRENTVYGQEGVRWFDEDYVSQYPQAVRGGIDDSWNDYLTQIGHESYTSDQTATSDEVSPSGDVTPVPTGNNNDVTATLGFCGGDDESEYLVTQECNTPYCETDRSVQGVAKVPGSCVLKSGENTRYETNVDERSIFRPGERVELTNTGVSIACFNGAWFSDWPINFNQDEITVPLGETRSASFSVVNIRNTETTFRVSMLEDTSSGDNEPSAEQFAEFASSSGDSFTTTVDPTSSKSFRMEFTGGREDLDDELTVQAEAINAGLSGSDSIQVDVGSSTGGGGGAAGQTEEVPGIQSLQVLMLVLFSTLVYFRQ